MYDIRLDGKPLWYPGDDEAIVINPELNEALNDAGYIQFTVPEANPLYNDIKERISMVQVYKDDVMIFNAEVREVTVNSIKDKKVYAVGELAFLADSIQPQKRYQNNTVLQVFDALLSEHNAQVESKKQFVRGVVTVTDLNDSLYRYTNYEDTLTAMREKLCDTLDGYLRVRYQDGIRYLDFVTLDDYGKTCQQAIEFGENLMEYASNSTGADIATAIIPLGAKLDESEIEGLDAYTTIKSVNDGKEYIYSQEAVEQFGWIKKVVNWNDVTEPANLLKKAKTWLKQNQFANLTLEMKALDLSILSKNIESMELGDRIRAIAEPYGMDTWFPMQKKVTYFQHPENNKVTLSNTVSKTYTSQANKANAELKHEIPQQKYLVQLMQENASNLIKAATNGNIVLKMDDDGNPIELLIMDMKDISTAKNVWRWNLNGFGYSSTGYNGNYNTAITMDGRIVADYIASGTMSADRVKGGIFEVGGTGYGKDGKIEIKNDKGTTLITLDKSGMTLAAGQKISWNNISNAPSIPSKMSELENDEKYITDDGLTNIVTEITEDTIKTTNILCDQLKGGKFILGGSKLSDAEMIVYNKNDEEIGEWNKEGAYITSSSYIPAQYPTTWYGNKISTLSVNQSVKPNVSSSNSEYSMGVGNIVLGQYEYICNFDISEMQSSEKPAKIEVHFANITYNVQAGFGMIMFGVADSILYNFHFNSNDLIKTGRKSGKYVIDLSLNELEYFEIREIYNAKNIDSLKITAPWVVAETSDYGTALQIEHIDIIAANGTKILTLWNNIKSRIAGSVIDISDNMITMDDCIMKKNGFVLYENADLSGYTESDNGEYHTESRQFYLNTAGFMHLGIYNSTSTSSANVRINKDGTFHRYSSSSRRYKDNITKNIESDLDPTKLYDIDICQFKYKKDYLSEDDERYNKNIIGFIAEDLYEKYPICCDLNDGVPESPNYNMLIAPMLKLIQEQNERLKKLEKEVLQDDEY